jgi:hypothetical protein
MARSEAGIQQTERLLCELLDAEVECVVVGGVAAAIHGCTRLTEDLDLVAPLTFANCERILGVLQKYRPRFYQTLGRPPVERDAKALSEFKNPYFDTQLGIVDVLGSLPPVGDYARIRSRSIAIDFEGRSLQLVSLDDLISVKEAVGRPKDREVLIELKAIRDRLKGKVR